MNPCDLKFLQSLFSLQFPGIEFSFGKNFFGVDFHVFGHPSRLNGLVGRNPRGVDLLVAVNLKVSDPFVAGDPIRVRFRLLLDPLLFDQSSRADFRRFDRLGRFDLATANFGVLRDLGGSSFGFFAYPRGADFLLSLDVGHVDCAVAFDLQRAGFTIGRNLLGRHSSFLSDAQFLGCFTAGYFGFMNG